MGRRGCYSYCYFYVLMQFLNMAPKHNCYKCDYGLCYSPDLSRWGGVNGQVRGVFYIVFFQERPEVTMFMFMGKWLRVKMVLMQVFLLEASLTLVIYLSDTNLVYQAKAMQGISFKELHNSTMSSNLLRYQLQNLSSLVDL